MFYIQSAGNGYYYLKPKNNTNLALDVSGASSYNGANVQVWDWWAGNTAQKWRLRNLDSREFYSSVSGLKSTEDRTPATFHVNTNGKKSYVTVWAYSYPFGNLMNPATLERSSTLNVKIVSGNKVIKNEVVSGKKNTFTIDKKYKSYTVYVSKRILKGNNIITSTYAGGKNFQNFGNYCQVSLENASLR